MSDARAPWRVGVVGCGAMGRRRLASFRASPAFRVVGVADTDPAALEWAPADLSRAPSAEALLEQPLDAVVLAVPTGAAAQLTAHALSLGLHVLCEKPPARSSDELGPVLGAAERHPSQVLMYGFNHRLHASVRAAHALLAGGTLGAIRAARGAYTKSALGAAGDWRLDPALAGGGILLDQGIHLLDLLLGFLGPCEVASARVLGPPGSETYAAARLVSAHDVTARVLSAATALRPHFQLDLTLERGRLSLVGLVTSSGRYAPERLVVRRPGAADAITEWLHDDSLDRERDAFAAAIEAANGGSPLATAHGRAADAAAALRLVESIYACGGAR